jgi:hypothetical protein
MANSKADLAFARSYQAIASPLRLSDDLIERFVRFAESLDVETREAIARCLPEQPAAQAVALFYEDVYRELDRLDPRIPERVTTFVDSLFA